MKTQSYNLKKAIISAAFVLAISTVSFAATKSNETPTPVTNNNFKALAPNSELPAALAGYSSEASSIALTRQIEQWMSDESYWGVDNSSDLAEKVLTENIESWIANGSYWSVPRHHHNPEARLAHKIRYWMNNNSYWGTEQD